MNNSILDLFRSKLKLKVSGKHVKRFISKLIFHKIELLNINYLSDEQAVITIYKNSLNQILEIKTVYDLDIIDAYGYIKIKKIFKIDKFIISFLLFGIACVYILSNIIFSVEIVHTDKELISLLKKELAHYNIEEKKFKKSFKDIEKIKGEILSKYKDKLEWLEIESVGTKYIIRFEERKIIEPIKDAPLRHVIASKNAIIKKIVASSGVVVKTKNSYVKKGDVIISGEIKLNDEVKNYVSADGTVYGEVWYTVKTSFPYFYSEKIQTGKNKKLLLVKFFSHYYGFDFKKYDNAIISDKTIIKNSLLPISFVYQEQKETIDNSSILTVEEANYKAIEKSRNKIKEKLDDGEYIIYEKQLKKDVKDSKIIVEMFYTVYENITDYIGFSREE